MPLPRRHLFSRQRDDRVDRLYNSRMGLAATHVVVVEKASTFNLLDLPLGWHPAPDAARLRALQKDAYTRPSVS